MLSKPTQSSVLYRRIQHDHPKIARGEGVYLFEEDGTRYLDGSGGALVVNIGHGVGSVVQAIAAQTAQVAYIHGTMFTSEVTERYAHELAGICPLADARFYPLSSGSEAVEGAIKFARQVQVARGQTSRHLTIARWGSYHGATLGALAVTGKPKMRNLFTPMFRDMPHIPPPYCYRCPFELSYPVCNIRCATELENEILRQGVENVSAFIAEPVSGATLGAAVPPPEYWPLFREICDRYEVLLIADEVMTGMGRTGKWFAVEHWDVEPDIITIGKGAAGGYFPLSILAVKGEHADLIAAKSGDFIHGGTYTHHAVGAAAGLATLEYIRDNQLVEEVARKGPLLERALKERLGDLDWVADIRGIGMMWGVELVRDKHTKIPFEAHHRLGGKIADAALQNSLIIYPGGGCIDGTRGDHFMIGPPFTITEQQIGTMADILFRTIEEIQFG